MRLDHACAKSLRGLLITMVAFLLAHGCWRDPLDAIEHIEQGIAEKLGEHERTDHYAEIAPREAGNVRRVGHLTRIEAGRGSIKKRARSLFGQRGPGLTGQQAVQTGADPPAEILSHQAHS